ncbi:ester cyclase [Haloplanus aerogenes]|uniref:ester cyclase n=1 Tax=Haloplanus aerogenes TaxID=660522 RepID=UPI003744AEB0
MDDLLAPDFVGRGFGPENLDRDGYEEFVIEHREIFPDLEFVLDDVICADDRMANRWTRVGTHQKLITGIEPTGNGIPVSGMAIHRLTDGLIAEA